MRPIKLGDKVRLRTKTGTKGVVVGSAALVSESGEIVPYLVVDIGMPAKLEGEELRVSKIVADPGYVFLDEGRDG